MSLIRKFISPKLLAVIGAAIALMPVSSHAAVTVNTSCHAIPGAGRRVAVIVGNSGYHSVTFGELKTSTADAEDISSALCGLGFTTIYTYTDATRADLYAASRVLGHEGRGADFVLFYYAGHGVEFNGQPYLVPTDYSGGDDHYDQDAMPLDKVREQMRSANASALRLVLLNACRDNISMGSDDFGPGAPIGLDENSLVVYATQQGKSAYTNNDLRNSYFTTALLQYLHNRKALSLEDVQTIFRFVARDVWLATGHQQSPTTYVAAFNPYYFLPDAAGEVATNLLAADTGMAALTPRTVAMGPSESKPDYATNQVKSESAFPEQGFVFTNSDTMALTEDELASKSDDQLRYAINEIYARHGYRFRLREFADYFGSQAWYHPWGRVGDQQSIYTYLLNDMERKNIDRLVIYRKKTGRE